MALGTEASPDKWHSFINSEPGPSPTHVTSPPSLPAGDSCSDLA